MSLVSVGLRGRLELGGFVDRYSTSESESESSVRAGRFPRAFEDRTRVAEEDAVGRWRWSEFDDEALLAFADEGMTARGPGVNDSRDTSGTTITGPGAALAGARLSPETPYDLRTRGMNMRTAVSNERGFREEGTYTRARLRSRRGWVQPDSADLRLQVELELELELKLELRELGVRSRLSFQLPCRDVIHERRGLSLGQSRGTG